MRIGINGIDNSGKSTHVRILPFFSANDVRVMESLSRYVPELALLPRESFQWWMGSSPVDFCHAIAAGVRARINDVRDDICILNRGTFMFKAVCLAKWSMHETRMSVPRLSEYVSGIFCKHGVSEDEVNVLLTKDQRYIERTKTLRSFVTTSAHKASPFNQEENRLYDRYQSHLAEAVEQIMSESGVIITVPVGSSILAVQNAIRTELNAVIGKPVFISLAAKTDRVVGLSGMSESGKSTMAEKLVAESGGFRLKLNFFNFEPMPDCSQEESIAVKLLLFCHTHYFRRHFTIESLHGIALSAYLKLFFGDMFQIVYLDTPFDERARRWQSATGVAWEEAAESVRGRDAEKEALGCSRIMYIADKVVQFGK